MLTFVRPRLILLSVLYSSLAGILLYSWLLQAMNLPSMIFHALFILSACTVALVATSPEGSTKIKLFAVVSWIIALQLANSYALRLAADILSIHPDPLYLQQLVRSILASGSANMGAGIGPPAFEYSFYPVPQVFTAILILVTGANIVAIMKFLPSILSPIILLVLFCFYRNFLSDKDAVAATLIAGSCFWFLYFESEFEQATFGTLFSCIALLSLTKKGAPWRALSTISLVAVAFSQLLSGVYLIVILGAAKVYMLIKRKFGDRSTRMTLSSLVLAFYATVVLAWLFQSAFSLTPALRTIFLEGLYGTPIHFALSAAPESANPLVTRVVGDIGVVLFGSILILSFVYINFRGHEHRLADLLPYAFGSAVLCAAHIFVFSFAFYGIKDLLPRGLWYVYLIATPLAVFGLSHEWRRIQVPTGLQSNSSDAPNKPKLRVRPFLVYSAIILILLSSMYFYYPADRYDNSQPASAGGYTTLVRLPLEQWVSVGVWSSYHIGDRDVYGDKVANVFVGGLGAKYVHQFPSNGSLRDWVQSSDLGGSVLVLRMSILDEPHYQLLVDSNQLSSIIDKNNVVYNSGDPVILIILA